MEPFLGDLARTIYRSEQNCRILYNEEELLAEFKECIRQKIKWIAMGSSFACIRSDYMTHLCIEVDGRHINYNVKYEEFFENIRPRLINWLKEEKFNIETENTHHIDFSWE